MDAVLLVARVVLAAVFVVAGLAKLADRQGTRTAARDFGAPESLAGALAVLIPLAELAVAVLLLPATTAVWGAIGALVLLAVFSAAIGLAMARGKAPDCHCFGRLHSEPSGWKTLARNGVLAAFAALVLAGGGGPSAVAWIAKLQGPELVALAVGAVALAVVAIAACALLHVMRSYGRVLGRLERLERMLGEAGFDLHAHDEMPEIGLAPGGACAGVLAPERPRRHGDAAGPARARAASRPPVHEPNVRAVQDADADSLGLAARPCRLAYGRARQLR